MKSKHIKKVKSMQHNKLDYNKKGLINDLQRKKLWIKSK